MPGPIVHSNYKFNESDYKCVTREEFENSKPESEGSHQKIMVARRLKLLLLTIPDGSTRGVPRTRIVFNRFLESGALARPNNRDEFCDLMKSVLTHDTKIDESEEKADRVHNSALQEKSSISRMSNSA